MEKYTKMALQQLQQFDTNGVNEANEVINMKIGSEDNV